ncbi:MAG: hypothetical protein ACR2I1_08705, partial [Propionibacteriaceae bacterium]
CGAGEVPVHFAGDGSFQQAHDFGFGSAGGDLPGDVGPRRWMAGHPHDRDAVQGVVGVPVPAA